MTSRSVIAGYDGGGGRAYKGHHCKKFYTEEGCPYGDTVMKVIIRTVRIN
jgi:hypothetical protein